MRLPFKNKRYIVAIFLTILTVFCTHTSGYANTKPVFIDGASTTRTVAENTASGANIGTAVAATDVDNDVLIYSLSGTDASSFSIVRTSGQLQTNVALDYETKTSYSVTVSVSDSNGGSSNTTVTINVKDVNEKPYFAPGGVILTVVENTTAGTNIGDPFQAMDPDSGDTLTYSLERDDKDAFRIDANTGQLRTHGALDYETKRFYTDLAVRATDSTGLVGSVRVTINVKDVPENNAPVFTDGSRTTRSVLENTASGESIGSAVAATDADNDTLIYSLGGTDASSFSIVSTSGQLQTNAVLDYETKTSYSVTVSVSDGKGGSDSIPVTINVTNANEMPANTSPIFTDGTSTTRTIAENAAFGTNIGTPVDATDVDSGTTLTYRLGGTDASSFSIVRTSGQLQTRAALDYETKSAYSVRVSVSDGNDGSDSIPVTINVRDVNEKPYFAPGGITLTVAENTASGTNIGNPFQAIDPDSGDTLTYSLERDDKDAFRIDANTGQLRTHVALDYETKRSYTDLAVRATDSTGLVGSILVRITVTDVDETPTNNAPVFTDGTTATRTIAENTVSGANIGSAVAATDADNDTLTYRLGGPDAASFSIVNTTGQLQTNAALDYETKTSYSVTVSVSDGNGGSDSITVTITVRDVDETPANNAPIFTDGTSTTRSVAENTAPGTNIGNPIAATDADNDTLTYTLGGTDAALFRIVRTSGQLQTNVALDYETKSSYSVSVSVSDGKGGSDSIPVTIRVSNLNEKPYFAPGGIILTIAENTAPGTNIGDPFQATDPDSRDTLTYSLERDDKDAFRIDANTGQLRTHADLDYETKRFYTDLAVRATDSTGLVGSVRVTINVKDVPENNAPVFTEGRSATRTVAEDAAIGTNIGAPVAATDADNDTLTYGLNSSNPAVSIMFSLDRTSGQLQTLAPLDYERRSSYSLTVVVSDSNGVSDSIAVTINVTDVDENRAPVFSEGSSATRTVAENTPASINIGAPVAATDADNDTLTYRLGGTDAASFSIVSTTGQLQTSAALDYETKTSYSVTVSASDGNGGSDNIPVTIRVTNVNETPANNAPIFTDGTSTTRNVAENTASGANIGTPITATDADANTTLTYRLGGTDAGSFSIISTSGQLQTSAALDYETKTSYSVSVSVFDGNGGSDSITVTINVTDVTEISITPPLSDRTPQVRDAIVRAVPGVNNANDVTAAHLAAIRQLGLSSRKISSLKTGDFNGLTALFNLRLHRNSITDISPLEDLTSGSLVFLILDENKITDISPLGSLTSLVTLGLDDNSISDISALENLTALRMLTLGNSVVNGILVGNNKITDISPLEGLTSITWLTLTKNSISDISPLEGLTKLTHLHLFDNKITDISPLEDLTALEQLLLDGNKITNISVLENLTKLRNLTLDGNKITDISVLEGLTSLVLLGLGNTSISDISVLENLTKLRYIHLDGNSISDISVLENLTKLTKLYLNNNSITDISALEGLTSLTKLYLDGNSISDVSVLAGLTSLETLRLQGNPISDYGPLRRLKAANPGVDIDIDIHNNIPVFTDGASTTRSIAENTASGTNIGDAVSATDADTNDTLTYTLGGTDAESFSIVSTTGQLQTKAALDYETQSSYTVTVDVSDGKGGTDRINVTINVTDEAAAAPSVELPPVIPENTALLTNFPNPFNPETWIPYQLAEPAEVTLTIYDIRGVVVRELKLGHQAAGFYQSRSQAIYWDGRNRVGKKVASGLYFYTLTAGDFTATRKLLIRK